MKLYMATWESINRGLIGNILFYNCFLKNRHWQWLIELPSILKGKCTRIIVDKKYSVFFLFKRRDLLLELAEAVDGENHWTSLTGELMQQGIISFTNINSMSAGGGVRLIIHPPNLSLVDATSTEASRWSTRDAEPAAAATAARTLGFLGGGRWGQWRVGEAVEGWQAAGWGRNLSLRPHLANKTLKATNPLWGQILLGWSTKRKILLSEY